LAKENRVFSNSLKYFIQGIIPISYNYLPLGLGITAIMLGVVKIDRDVTAARAIKDFSYWALW